MLCVFCQKKELSKRHSREFLQKKNSGMCRECSRKSNKQHVIVERLRCKECDVFLGKKVRQHHIDEGLHKGLCKSCSLSKIKQQKALSEKGYTYKTIEPMKCLIETCNNLLTKQTTIKFKKGTGSGVCRSCAKKRTYRNPEFHEKWLNSIIASHNTQSFREKMSASRKLLLENKEWREKWLKSFKTPEARSRRSKAMIERHRCPEFSENFISTLKNNKKYWVLSAEHLWSLEVKKRDNNVCLSCNSNDDLKAHHILPKHAYPDYRFELWNGITLCHSCHVVGKTSAHGILKEAMKSNTPSLYVEWISNIVSLDERIIDELHKSC
jgi:hypothetical protein